MAENFNPAPPQASFADIVSLLAQLPPLPPLADASPSLWLAQAQQRPAAQLLRPKLALFCASHSGRTLDAARLAPWLDGSAPALQACTAQDMEVQLFDLTDAPVADNRQGPALTEPMAANAMIYGMTLPGQGYDLLALASLAADETGAGTAARAIVAALQRQDSDDAGAQELIAANRPHLTDPLNIARVLGGHDICAMIGAIMAARMAKLPVLLEGLPALAAALVIGKLAGRDGAVALAHVRAIGALSDPKISNLISVLPDCEAQAGAAYPSAAAVAYLHSALGQV